MKHAKTAAVVAGSMMALGAAAPAFAGDSAPTGPQFSLNGGISDALSKPGPQVDNVVGTVEGATKGATKGATEGAAKGAPKGTAKGEKKTLLSSNSDDNLLGGLPLGG
ncbi:hypothetical protein [Streptomyces daliensis]|uniref:ATP-binding protein n=1 Tax=Streptomyces daliensis TaxID=299421 RepID=A0A8T4IV74_9ACTN|nr:hypothetical protein [Streptomyces daliensis]